MNNKLFFSILLFFFACSDDVETTITNSYPDLPEGKYELELQSNSGESLTSVTISWQQSNEDMILTDENGSNTITENYYTYDNMIPGEFKDIQFELTLDDSTYKDTMQIFSRSLFPITNLTINIDVVSEYNGYWDEEETFYDGNGEYDLGEVYVDGNETYDFKDIDGDDTCDYTGDMEAGTFMSNECEPFIDSNNGSYDLWEEYEDGNGTYNIEEEYVDGNGSYDFGEDFTDSNNGVHDPWEDFTDSNNGAYDAWEEYEDGNGTYDFGEDFVDGNGIYDPQEPFTDSESLCLYDDGEVFVDSNNGTYDYWEDFTDSNNDTYDPWEDFTDSNNDTYDPWEDFTDSENGNGVYDVGESFVDGNGVYDVGESFVDGNGVYDVGESFVDGNGVYDVGENFTDSESLCIYDEGEIFVDSNNGTYDYWEDFTDSNNGSYESWESFVDGNGVYDLEENYVDGNGVYDFGEDFVDSNNGFYDPWEDFTDSNNGAYDPWEEYEDGNSTYDFGEEFTDSENGVHDPWEYFTDSVNGIYDLWEDFDEIVTNRYYRELSWEKTLEPEANHSAYVIHRTTKNNLSSLFDPKTCNCQVDTLSTYQTNYYKDSDSLVLLASENDGYFYRIEILKEGFSQFGFITPSDNCQELEQITLTENNVSTDKDNYVAISWEPEESAEFYQYEIYRVKADGNALNDTSVVAIMKNPNMDHFLDRTAGNGNSWKYSIAMVDICDNKIYSDFIIGAARP